MIKDLIRYSISPVRIFIFFIFKKNENLYLCVDYRMFNKIIVKNRHPLFLITEIINRLSESVIFIKLNLKNVYYKIRIREKDE